MIELRERAIGLLARREHSRLELKQKLIAKGYRPAEVSLELEGLAKEGLQSDGRYTEAYIRKRVSAGFGPQRIATELRQHGISDSLIGTHLPQTPEFWGEVLLSVFQKKYHTKEVISAQEYAKAARFLTQRGFDAGQVHRLLRTLPALEFD